jgi:galactokinase
MISVTAEPRSRLLDAIESRSRADFGAGALRYFFAPGRINLVGAHLDYSGGDVMPMAVDRGIYAGVRRNDDGRIRLRSIDQELAVDVGVDEVGDVADKRWGWGGYPLGIWRSFQRDHGVQAGFDAVFAGDVPIASGLSSSAAIEVVTALALDALAGTGLDREAMASMAHRAENDFVGVRCGIMDQYASALGQPGKVLWMRCQGPRWEHVPFDPEACEVLVMDTRKPRKLAASGFNERVEQCAAARAFLSEHVRDERHLASYSVEDLESVRDRMDPVLYRRARHVATEMGRIAAGAEALRDHDYAGLGAQLDASHRSTATDYDVSCDELDVITDAARACDGVFGARLTGAGFGGCAIALIEPGHRERVAAHVSEVFGARFGVEPGFDLLRIGDGPGEIDA